MSPLKWLRSLGAWETVKDTGCHLYQVNTMTGARTIIGGSRGHQPIDRGWLETGEWTKPRPPGAQHLAPINPR